VKPSKFAFSTAVYVLTLAWVFTYLPGWARVRRFVGRTTAFVMLLEVSVIDLQAWRGTTSHFNVGTPLDGVLFAAMGLSILAQTLSSVAVAFALWRQRFDDQAMGWALRFGMTLTICGALVGGIMTAGPTEAQMAEAKVTGHLAVAGAHTVGAPDGGPGLPSIGWSTEHGDLRVPHFVGLHAIQALALVAFLTRHRQASTRMRLVGSATALYALTFVFLLFQALSGMPLVAIGENSALGGTP
jgi:hypothetical protein